MKKKHISIGEASRVLGVSVDTLRRWDKSGRLKAQRSAGGHRYYSKDVLKEYQRDIFALARIWVESSVAPPLADEYYCETRDRFQARLGALDALLTSKETSASVSSLVTAVVGEIGNNSFDHNLGAWRDVPGIFFAYSETKEVVVLADRGQGIRETLLRVRPHLADDTEALTVAFTEIISGRSPEQRGNGLKFVRKVAAKYPIGVELTSGTATARIRPQSEKLAVGLAERNVPGTLARITF